MGNMSDFEKVLLKINSSINKAWNWLIEPSAEVSNIEDQRKSRLISSLSLISILIFVIYIVFFVLYDFYILRTDLSGEMLIYVIGDSLSVCILIGIFFVSRTRYYYISTITFSIVIIGILTFNILFEDESIYQVIFILTLFSFLIIFSSLFFSTRGVATGFVAYFGLFLVIVTVIKPQNVNVILLLGCFIGFVFLLIVLQNHYYYKRVAELEIAVTEREKARKQADFLNSLLTHDIANKLSRTQGYLSLMNRKITNEDKRKYLERALTACDESAELINKINHLRDIEDTSNLPLLRVNLNKMLNQVIDQYKVLAATVGIDIVFTEEEEEITVLGGDLLIEVFSNLIENTLQHSKASLMNIFLKQTSEVVSVVIEDNGIDIPENITKTLFMRGIKGDESKGSGIGLFLVKTIIDNVNANISLNQSSLGGAKFIIEFRDTYKL